MANHDDRVPSEQLEDSDLDAEGEEADEDYEVYAQASVPTPQVVENNEAGSDVDAEGEDDDVDAEGTTDHDDAEVESEESSEGEDNAWEESDGAGEVEDDKVADSGLCIFCGETEENDPSEEYEEYLECTNCGENSHRQCARDNGALDDDEDANNWKCLRCAKLPAETDTTPMLADELLPAIDSNSVFDNVIVDDDPMDGSRSLRKRKPSESEIPSRGLRKRRRASEDDSDSAERSGSPFDATGTDDPNDERSSSRPSRLRRPKKLDKPLVDIISSEGISLIVSFNLTRQKVQKILSSRPRKNRYREKMKRKIQVAPIVEPEPAHYPALPPGYNTHFLGLSERDTEDKKPYGGILNEAEADTSKTFPQQADRKRFEDARLKAEEDWKKKMAVTNNAPEPNKPSQKNSGPPSKIKCINFGGYEIDTWNAAPYPEEYSRNKILYICEFCLKYMNSDYVAWRHKLKCPAQHPPGDEIYRDGKHSFFEVDGRKNPVYCQNLCLLAKLFLGSKTLYYDVEPFLFYVMTENDELGCHFVGYFSKEKRPSSMNNVSCILVLPIYQRRGFGHMLIEFSYLLTKREQKTGSPEKPLSDMGLVSYRGYWRLVMCYQLVNQRTPLSIGELSKRTGMTPDDVISALEGLRALVRDPMTKTYALRLDFAFFKEYIEKYEKKNYPRINPDALLWTKYLMNRGLIQHYEGGGALQTVAPREEDEDDDEEGGKMDIDQGIDPEGEQMNMENGTEMVVDSTEEEAHTNGAIEDGESSRDGPSTPVRRGGGSRRQLEGTTTPVNHAVSSIPPSRFEIFPPFPGMYARKRGRPPGSGKRHLTAPRSTSAAITLNNPMANGSPSLRRTRSALVENSISGIEDIDEDSHDTHNGDRDATMGESQATNGGVEEEEDEDMDAEGEEE